MVAAVLPVWPELGEKGSVSNHGSTVWSTRKVADVEHATNSRSVPRHATADRYTEHPRPGPPAPVRAILDLQREAGNRAVSRLLHQVGADQRGAWVQRLLDRGDPETVAGLKVIRHLAEGDDPDWQIFRVNTANIVVEKQGRRMVIDPVTLEWSPQGKAEEGRRQFLAARPVQWTPDQVAKWVVFQYTATKYKAINNIVSGKDPKGESRSDLEKYLATTPGVPPDMTVDRMIHILEQTLTGLPELSRDVRQVTKGVNLERVGTIEPRYTVDDHREGNVYQVREFTSTSVGNPFTDRDSLIVYDLGGNHAGKLVPPEMTPSSNEREVLFPPGLKYRVLRVVTRESAREFEEVLAQLRITGEVPKLKRVLFVELLPLEGPERARSPAAAGAASSPPGMAAAGSSPPGSSPSITRE
jgi:hypothetical protein